MILIAAAALAASAAATTRTHAVLFRAFTSSGTPALPVTSTVHGSCFAASIAADRNDAWRCMQGNLIHDPCFSSANAPGIVLCSDAPWTGKLFEIKLTAALPKPGNTPKPSTSGRPWAITTFSGLKCVAVTGTTLTSGHHFGSYFCRGGLLLWDKPNRKHHPWTISTGRTKPTGTAQIKTAWF
jgi:hypothetical protein